MISLDNGPVAKSQVFQQVMRYLKHRCTRSFATGEGWPMRDGQFESIQKVFGITGRFLAVAVDEGWRRRADALPFPL